MKPSPTESGKLTMEPIANKIGFGIANGSFGELLQGALVGQENNFLVTLPIARYSRATFSLGNTKDSQIICSKYKTKSQTMARMVLNHFGAPQGGSLRIESHLPQGKGLASSSADLVATARAVVDSLGQSLTPDLLLSFLRKIEPTDGIMYPETVLFYHRKVELGKQLGRLPPLEILALDEGGEVDTIQYNLLLPTISEERKRLYAKYLEQISTAIITRDMEELGQVATQSAILNQSYAPKRNLQNVIQICKEIQGLGVVVAHSGSYLGILLLHQDPHFNEKKERGLSLLRRYSPFVSTFTSTHSDLSPLPSQETADFKRRAV